MTSNPGDDLDAAWDPRGGTSETVLASGPDRDIGIAGELTWVGGTGKLLTNERVRFHEYMVYDTGRQPITRKELDGNDEAFTTILAIPGGMGGDGLSASFKGSTVMWKIRTSHDPANLVVTINTAPFRGLNGRPANGFGSTVMSQPAAASGPDFEMGFSLGPRAGSFVISLKSGSGFDLSLRDTGSGSEIRRLTESGGALVVGECVARGVARRAVGGVLSPIQRRRQAGSDITGIDGSGLTRITDTPEITEAWPTWSLDSLEVAYGARAGADWDIYAVAVTLP